MQIQSSEAVTRIREASRRESLLAKLIADRLNARNVSNTGIVSLLVGNLLKRSALAVRISARVFGPFYFASGKFAFTGDEKRESQLASWKRE